MANTAPIFAQATGVVRNDIASPEQPADMLVQGDGKIVMLATFERAPLDTDLELVRFNPDGSLDRTFGSGGRVQTDVASTADTAGALLVQSDGRIVAVGSARPFGSGAQEDFTVVRYDANGTLDTTFGGGDGSVTTDFGARDIAKDVAIQNDGKLVVVGTAIAASGDFRIARYNPDGSPDTTFSGDGRLVVSIGSGYDSASAVTIQADGKIVVAGAASSAATAADFAVLRLNADGTPDTSFGSAGIVLTDFGGYNEAFDVALQADGKIVVVG